MKQKIVSSVLKAFTGSSVDMTSSFQEYLDEGWVIKNVSTSYVHTNSIEKGGDVNLGYLYTVLLEKED